jgi:hypothetical protein
MSLKNRQFLIVASAYILLNGSLAACALGLAGEVLRQSAGLVSTQSVAADTVPSRLEKFKLSERLAMTAPRVPVPRIIVAQDVPLMPVQALAIRLDKAESIAAEPASRKNKKASRLAKAETRTKPRMGRNGDLPPIVVMSEVSAVPVQKPKQRPGQLYALAESTRDITNRSLGVMVVGLK